MDICGAGEGVCSCCAGAQGSSGPGFGLGCSPPPIPFSLSSAVLEFSASPLDPLSTLFRPSQCPRRSAHKGSLNGSMGSLVLCLPPARTAGDSSCGDTPSPHLSYVSVSLWILVNTFLTPSGPIPDPGTTISLLIFQLPTHTFVNPLFTELSLDDPIPVTLTDSSLKAG